MSLWCKNELVLQKSLRYRIVAADEDDLDWELITDEAKHAKYFQVIMKKHEYIPGAVFWWSCVFKGDREIDVSTIAGRSGKRVADPRSDTFAGNWKMAHELFLEKIHSRQQNVVDIDMDEAGDV